MEYKTDEDSKPKLLVVDDEDMIRDLLSNCFSEKYKVHTAANEEEGLEYILKEQPVCVITDVEMKHRTNGFMMAVQARQEGYESPIVILSGKYTPDFSYLEEISGCSQARNLPDTHIGGKPFKPAELRSLVDRVVVGSREKLNASKSSPNLTCADPSPDYSA